MPVLPDFSPENRSYARSANAFLSGQEAGQSMVERKQLMELRQQQELRLNAEYLVKLPLLQAQATQAAITAKASVDAATERAQFETKAAAESPAANREFQDAISYNVANEDGYAGVASDGTPEGDAAQAEASKFAQNRTLEARAQKLASLRVKYGYMKGLGPYSAFYDTLTKETDNAHIDVAKDLKLDELMTAARIRADQQRYGSDKTFEGVQLKSQTSENVAGINADSRQTVATTEAEARRDAAIARAQKTYEFESTVRLRDEAISSHNTAQANEYQDRLNKMNSSASATVARETPTSVAPKPIPAGPSPSISVDIPSSGLPPSNGGNSYQPPANPSSSKLYVVDSKTKEPAISSEVKTTKDILAAYQQMIQDGVISAPKAREALIRLGFKQNK